MILNNSSGDNIFQRFYTYPPVEHPWVLRNIKQKSINCTHEIVDIGIYDLLEPPFQHSAKKLKQWKSLKTKGWKVVPDCPDLYGEFNQKINFNNVDYSWELLTKYYNPDNELHLPVIQSNYKNISSFNSYIKNFKKEYGIVNKIAIGTICKLNNQEIVTKMIKKLRSEFPNTWIHAFGLKLNHFRKVKNLIDSFDSTAWTFPRNSGRGSCKNMEERIQFFKDYINEINKSIRENHESIFISGALNANNSKDFLQNCHLMNYYASKVREITPYYYNPIADLNVTLTCGALKHNEWLQTDLYWLNKCDALFLIPNIKNKNSKGVEGELKFAYENKIPILKTLKEVKKFIKGKY